MLRLPSRLIAPLSALPRALRWALGLLLAFALLWGLALPLAAEPLLRWAIGRLEPQLGGHRLDFAQAMRRQLECQEQKKQDKRCEKRSQPSCHRKKLYQ